MEAHNWWSEVTKVQPDGVTELKYDPQPVHPRVGKATNKARPKRKPRPKKSER